MDKNSKITTLSTPLPKNVKNGGELSASLTPPIYGIQTADTPIIQAKLMIGSPSDPLEREADRDADQFVNNLQAVGITKPITPSSTILQRKTSDTGSNMNASPQMTEQIQTARGGGSPLPANLLSPLENSFGTNFSQVRLHTDSRADVLNQSLQARAFTTGQDIFFRQGEFQPNSIEGVRLLGHELSHVVQQQVQNKEIVQKQNDSRAENIASWAVEIRRQILALPEFRGITNPDDIGVLSDYESLGEERARELFGVLRNVINSRVGGLGRGWIRRLDDLGIPDHPKYHYDTVLHYVERLNILSRNSMGGRDWREASRFMQQNSSIDLAGADRVVVHPRMLYFAASAQVGMDRIANIQEGEGHYIAPAAVFVEITRIQTLAERVVQLSNPAIARTIYPNLLSRINNIRAINARNIAMRNLANRTHYEPELEHFFTTQRVAELQALPQMPSEEQLLPQITRLIQILGTSGNRPSRRDTHGWGALDLHGTEHAMGTALDMFTTGARTNFAPDEDAWEFIQYLIAVNRELIFRNPAYSALRELYAIRNITNLKRAIYAEPLRILALSRLVSETGTNVYESIRLSSREISNPDTQSQVLALRRLKMALQHELIDRFNILQRVTRRGSTWFRGNIGVLDKARDIFNHIFHANRSTIINLTNNNADPVVLKDFLILQLLPELNQLTILADNVPSSILMPPQIAVNPSPRLHNSADSTSRAERRRTQIAEQQQQVISELDPNNNRLMELKQTLEDHIVSFSNLHNLDRRHQINEKLDKKPRARAWIAQMTLRGGVLFDQDETFTGGLSQVVGTNMYGGHHWQWGTGHGEDANQGQGIFLSNSRYTSALLADMMRRDETQMRQILRIMVQASAGRRIIFGQESTEHEISASTVSADEFQSALRQWATSRSVSVEELIRNIQPDIPQGGRGARNIILTQLRRSGYFNLANQI